MIKIITDRLSLNSLDPGRFQRNFRKVIFHLFLVIDGWSISCKIVLKWMPMEFTDGKLTLVQVMAWCRQATSHYLRQCWPWSLSPYGVIRLQWVKAWLLTLNVRRPSYLGLTRSISCLLMPWLLTSPGHQQPWYWLCRICRSWSYLRKHFKYLCHINVE